MNWKQAQLRYVARLAYGDSLPNAEERQEGEFQVFGSNGPFANFIQANTKYPAIIIGRKGSYGKINWSPEPCFASDTTFFIDKTTTNHDLRWLYYALQILHLDEGSNESAVPGLNRDDAYEKVIFIPSIPEQLAIADYLDRETARLDALIAAKERLLDLLAEKRRAMITHAVTHGLNPNMSLRDSGVEWIGEIPSHWEVEYARWLFREIDERSQQGEEDLLTVSHITGVTLRSEKDVNMFMAESNEGYKMCQRGDLVINTLWAWMGAMGIAFQDGIVSPAYNVYRLRERYIPEYIDLLVRMPAFAQEVIKFSKGVWSSRLRLYPDEFFQVLMPVPPISEQKQIAIYIEKQTTRIDRLAKLASQTIDLLHERRAALIAAAVSGQIQVV